MTNRKLGNDRREHDERVPERYVRVGFNKGKEGAKIISIISSKAIQKVARLRQIYTKG